MRHKNTILGISAYYHDSAAVLLSDGEIIAAAQEERFTRKKHDPAFPSNAVRYVLSEAGVEIPDLSAVIFYDKPFLKFERLLETYHSFAPRGIKSFLAAMPVWIKEKLFLRKILREELEKIHGKEFAEPPNLLFSEHHLSHAASAFYPSPYEESAILTIDGVGEWATAAIAYGKGKDITFLKELHFPHSLGLLYSAFTHYCGFKVNSGEYKLMGLAPYGHSESERVKKIKELIYRELIDVRADGSLLLHMEYFNFATELEMCDMIKWEKLFGIPPRKSADEITEAHMDMALSIQEVTEDIMLRLARTAQKLTGSKNLVLSGGVALNCVANGKLAQSGIFENIWVQPASGDAGGALGAAYAAHHIFFNEERRIVKSDAMRGSYLGPQFSHIDIERVSRKYCGVFHTEDDFDTVAERTAGYLNSGKVVGWFQGRMEWGPRALGNRTILGDPRNPAMQKHLNLKIKYREGFRPFAPSVKEEEMQKYFDMPHPSPYMLFVAPVKKERRRPPAQKGGGLYERLYALRSDIPAVTHIDYSARVQTVSKATNERYWKLLDAFEKKTGYGLLVNTSFNVRGEPIVCTPDDAYRCFMATEMDCLVMGNFIFLKEEQSMKKEDFINEYAAD